MLFAGLMIRFIRTARRIRTARITSRNRLFDSIFGLFLWNFQDFCIADLIFGFAFGISFLANVGGCIVAAMIIWSIRFFRKWSRSWFKCECFKLDLGAAWWSLAGFTSEELRQFLWHLAW